MNIVYLGSGEFGIACLDALSRSEHALRFVVTQPPNPAGRGRRPRPTPVASWAAANAVPFLEAPDVNAPQVIAEIEQYGPDLILVIAFGQKVGSRLTCLPPKGAVNVHASLLPKYRGAAPVNWAIINGETRTGVSIITVADRIDAGQILAQSATDIGPNEAAGSLHDRLAGMAPQLLLDTFGEIAEGTAVYTCQDHSKATLAPKLKKRDGYLDFSEPAENLRRKILGFWPWPGASAAYVSKETGKSLRVTLATADVIETSGPPGLPVGTLDGDLNVICGSNALRIRQIKPDGSRLMDFSDFVNGRQTRPGDLFTKIDSPGT
jgi:methionyl-tRNA formyltransferase